MPGLRPFWFLCLLVPSLAFGSANAFRTLVVVNTNSADSVELGAYYAEQHGIPSHQICPVNIATGLTTIASNVFHDSVLAPITNHLAAEELAGQIDFVVLCWDFPTRVESVEGVSASLFYGFQDAPGYNEGGIGCNLPEYTSNAYYRAERTFHSAAGWNATNGFIAFHLIASNLPTAKGVVDRGAAAQSTFPAASVNLHIYGSASRGVREARFAHTQFSFTALPGLPATCRLGPYLSYLNGSTNAMGYHDGFAGIPANVRTNNVWLPGAYADHLTSLGGCLPTNVYKQSTVLDWMEIGATASYGTVAEPCNYLEKFPDPLMGFWYARGFTIGEAYAMAVEAPYQGLFAGDPLAAPFAAGPVVTNLSLAPNAIVAGTATVQVAAVARPNGTPAAALDLYVDGRFQTNLAAVAPLAGNELSVGVAGRTNSVAVGPGDTLFAAVSNLAAAVNADTGSVVSARAYGDRLELVYENFNPSGDHLPVAAFAETGTAAALAFGVGLAGTNLYPSVYPARKQLLLYAHTNEVNSSFANAGDTITLTITLTNGLAVTNVHVAAAGQKITNLIERMALTVNTNVLLQGANGVRFSYLANGIGNVVNDVTLFARTNGSNGWGIQVDYVVAPVATNYGLRTNYNVTGFMDDNPDDVRPRANVLFHVRPTNDVLAATAELDTANLPDGIHWLDFIARDGSAVAAQSRFTLPLFVCNTSSWFSALGTNGQIVAGNETPSLAKGTDFGRVVRGQAHTNLFRLYNNGTTPLAITNWTTTGPHASSFQISGIPAVIETGAVSNLTVVFAPATDGVCQASFEWESDGLLPQTNLLLAGTGAYGLTVAMPHGKAQPSVGLHANLLGAVLTNSVSIPAAANGIQLVCAGWSMSGNDPLEGSTNVFTMTVTNHAALVWRWTTNYWLNTTAGANGSVNVADAWQPGGTTAQITALADAYYRFTNWTGSASGTNNPLALLMDGPKAVQANFTALLATNAVPQWWLAQYGWTNDFDAAALADPEPDGYFTWQEYLADTDPTNGVSFPRMAFIDTFQTNFPILTWPFSTGRLYSVQWCDDIVGGEWTGLPLGLGVGEWTDTNPPPATGRWYRIAPQVP